MRRLPLFLVLVFILACENAQAPVSPSPDGASPTDGESGAAIGLVRFRDIETGSTWNLAGNAIAGPLEGQRLRQVPAYTAYWFAWSSFWPDAHVHGEPPPDGNGHADAVRKPVPPSEILADVPPDNIPPLDDPPEGFGTVEFVPANDAALDPDEIVLGVEIAGDARAYPVRILNRHEIANHSVGGRRIALTYCPLTASGINFDGSSVSFGNSGALYNNNLVMYDRATRDLWSQIRTYGISGDDVGRSVDVLPVVQGTWAAWKAMHPHTQVLSADTGYRRDYEEDSYIKLGYTESSEVWFAQQPEIDTRYHPKEWTLGLLSTSAAKAYPFETLGEDASITNDRFDGRDIVVVFDRAARMAIPYDRSVDGTILTFERVGRP